LDATELVSSAKTRDFVQKAWGMEDWIHNTPEYCGKVLTMREGWQSSLHYHPIKEETMLCIDGCCVVEIYPDGVGAKKQFVALRAEEGSALHIPRSVPHRFMTSMGSTCVLVEFSTMHDDADVVRLEESREIYAGH
jgi:dTDP-4-dehydrorhamnose 3,5-epimerase-like enzyme